MKSYITTILIFISISFIINFNYAQNNPIIVTTSYGADSIVGSNIKMDYYYLIGNNFDEIQKQVEERRNKDPNAKHFMARTRTRVFWNWDGYGKSECNLNSLSLRFEATIQFPRWKMPPDLNDADKKKWLSFISGLSKHELGHVLVDIEQLLLLEKRIKNSTCTTADGNARGGMQELDQAQLRYDDVTIHGWLQGAKL